MNVKIKQGVLPHGIQPEILLAILICSSVFDELGQKFTITSLYDGDHMPGSLHKQGKAFDIRIFDLRGILAHVVCDRLHDALGSVYTVILEPDHIHVEYDYEKVEDAHAAF